MTRHSRNNTARQVFTYHEKKMAASEAGWGSKDVRLGKDSVQEFDCCCLTLQPCQDAVITPDGILYDKAAILENMLHQKTAIAKKMKEYTRIVKELEAEEEVDRSKEFEAKRKRFVAAETSVAAKSEQEKSTDKAISNMKGETAKKLPSFWVPSQITESTVSVDTKRKCLSAPDEKVRCPVTNKPLRMKDLISIKFTRDHELKTSERGSAVGRISRYVCPITGDSLTNATGCAVLKTSGNVISMAALEKVVRVDRVDPTNGRKVDDSDIIVLQRGATGFSDAKGSVELIAKQAGPSIMIA